MLPIYSSIFNTSSFHLPLLVFFSQSNFSSKLIFNYTSLHCFSADNCSRKVFCVQVCPSASHQFPQNLLDEAHLFSENEPKVQPVGLAIMDDVPTPRTISQGFSADCIALDCRAVRKWTLLRYALSRFLRSLKQSFIPSLPLA